MITTRRKLSRRGAIFVAALILLSGMSVIIIALAHEVALNLRMTEGLVEGDQALEAAKIGLENAIYLAGSDVNWRTTYVSGQWIVDKPVGDAKFTVSCVDDDGNLSDCPIDQVAATSTAAYKNTTRTLSATLSPPPHDALMYLVYAGGGSREIKILSDCRIFGDLCAKKVTLDSGTPDHRGNIYAEKADSVSSDLKDADTQALVYQTEPLSPEVDLEWFVSRGSQLTPPVNASDFLIADKVISPDSNPYGFSNANGIYYIRGGRELRITRCHITATIVVLTGKKVYFQEASVHAPAFPYYPALVMSDELYYSFDQNLSESESGVDFNRDGDTTDVLTPSVSGVVYAKKKLVGLQSTGGTNVVRFKGVLISDDIQLVGAGCIFEQDASLSTALINQFQGNGLRLVPGTMQFK